MTHSPPETGDDSDPDCRTIRPGALRRNPKGIAAVWLATRRGSRQEVALPDEFLAILRRREGGQRPAWLDAAAASGVDELKRFAGKRRAEQDAVQAGLALRWSDGQTEGQITRLKMVKRQGDGRANFDRLRKRVLRATRDPRCPASQRRPDSYSSNLRVRQDYLAICP